MRLQGSLSHAKELEFGDYSDVLEDPKLNFYLPLQKE